MTDEPKAEHGIPIPLPTHLTAAFANVMGMSEVPGGIHLSFGLRFGNGPDHLTMHTAVVVPLEVLTGFREMVATMEKAKEEQRASGTQVQ